MYSRYPGREEPPLRLPEHYSGCAFRRDGENRPPIPTTFEEPDRGPDRQPPPPQTCAPPQHDPLRNLFGGVLPDLPVGMHGDELLLVGLILLLARSEEGADIALWLALLLFCK